MSPERIHQRRIQRLRSKGWRMPEGARSVTRPGHFGNPFRVGDTIAQPDGGGDWYEAEITPDLAVALFRAWITNPDDRRAVQMMKRVPELAGLDLACYCPPDQPCHADVLLELANPAEPKQVVFVRCSHCGTEMRASVCGCPGSLDQIAASR